MLCPSTMRSCHGWPSQGEKRNVISGWALLLLRTRSWPLAARWARVVAGFLAVRDNDDGG